MVSPGLDREQKYIMSLKTKFLRLPKTKIRNQHQLKLVEGSLWNRGSQSSFVCKQKKWTKVKNTVIDVNVDGAQTVLNCVLFKYITP